MNENRRSSGLMCLVAILCTVCFLTFAQGAVTQALAAEEWETWPKKAPEKGAGGTTGAADAGKVGGTKHYAGMTAGTIGWIALGTAAVVGIAIAAGGGGGGGTSSPPACNQ